MKISDVLLKISGALMKFGRALLNISNFTKQILDFFLKSVFTFPKLSGEGAEGELEL